MLEPQNCYVDIAILKVNSCIYLGINICMDLSYADQVKYMVKKAWKVLHFTMCILEMGNNNTRCLAYT
jgi:hypothetical protein